MIQPPYLQLGDTIGLTCPAGFIGIEKVQECVHTLEQWGFRVILGKTVGSNWNYFSATDSERANELQEMLDDPSIKAVLCARGGYGVTRIIDQINFTGCKAHPKWVIGFSDITVLHAALLKQDIMSIHGPMAAAFSKGLLGEPYMNSLKNCLQGNKNSIQSKGHSFNVHGTATGALVGGNLCLISHLIGSEWELETSNKILFIEDIGEYHYNLDRMMIQCKRAGIFSNLAGLIVGGFSDFKDKPTDFGASPFEIIQSHLSGVNCPVGYDFPISHQLENFAVKQGANYDFKVDDQGANLQDV